MATEAYIITSIDETLLCVFPWFLLACCGFLPSTKYAVPSKSFALRQTWKAWNSLLASFLQGITHTSAVG